MGSSSIGLPLRLLLPFFLMLGSNCQTVEWDASNFPNPTAGDFKRCNMRTTANICDPDEVLSESQRYRLNHELHQLESRTRQDRAPDFCQKKGITAAMAIVKHVRGGSEAAVKEMANQILRKWTLDDQCQKSVVFVVATEDRRFWVARDPRVPVYAQEFTQIFSDQKQLFQQGKYPEALGNILRQTWEKALSKQGQVDAAGGDRGGIDEGRGGHGPTVGPRPSDIGPGPDSGRKRGGLLPHVPFWVWLVIILSIIPLLCCCCLCYCCCCRKGASNSPRRQGPSDVEGGGGRPIGAETTTGHRGGGGGMNSFLGVLGGAGLGNLVGRLMGGGGGSGRGLFGMGEGGRRDIPREPGYQGGGAYPAAPIHPAPKGEDYGGGGGGGTGGGGKGFYPSVAVRDEGGGGGW